jgi:hypothetical protein
MSKNQTELCGKCGAEIDLNRRVDFTLKDRTRVCEQCFIHGNAKVVREIDSFLPSLIPAPNGRAKRFSAPIPCNLLGGWISLRLPCLLTSRSFLICDQSRKLSVLEARF